MKITKVDIYEDDYNYIFTNIIHPHIEKGGNQTCLGKYKQCNFNEIYRKDKLKYYTILYGEKQGYQKYLQICKNSGPSLEKMINKYGKNEGIKKWKEFKQKSANTLENFIKRYGEQEGLLKYKSYIKKLHGTNTLKWYVNKYGLEKGTELYSEFCKKSASLNLENILKKYGDEGYKIYDDRVKKLKEIGKNFYNNLNPEEKYKYFKKCFKNKYSSISLELFQIIEEYLKKYNIQYTYLYGNSELSLFDNENNCFKFYDFCVKEKNKIIEFNGDYWHANPKLYNENDKIKLPGGKEKLVKDIWKKDYQKIKLAKNNNYEVLIIWENDYIYNKSEIINKCLEFILGVNYNEI